MQKWIYGLASYSRNAAQGERIEANSGTLPMEGFRAEDSRYMTSFLKRAGELGWELAGIMEPHGAGTELSAGPQHDGKLILAEAADLQWLIFKKPE